MSLAGLDPRFVLTGVKETGRGLGNGSLSTLMEVEYNGLKYASKKIHAVLYDSFPTVHRFEEECRIMSQVHHPNIVQFVGVYFQQGECIPCLVMELLPTDLTSCIEQHSILPKEISFSILHDVALGLHYLHSRDPPIMHRDISSNNILLTHNMTAKIGDFGMARMLPELDNISCMTQAPGTFAFMPPEALTVNSIYNTSIDVFSFGILMIHMFSGQWPKPQNDTLRIEHEELIPVGEAKRREVFQAIGDDHPATELILQCIDNDPQQRPCASEILQQLRRISQNLGEYRIVHTCMLSMQKEFYKWYLMLS